MSTEASATAGASETPLNFLQSIAQSDPSPQVLHLLSEEIASLIKQSTDLCAPYLYAVAKQFPAYHVAISSASVAEAHADNRAVASRENDPSQSLSTIVSTVGFAVSQCQPRTEISKSGILAVLSQQLPPAHLLHHIHVEFLQACIFAEQYSFAESHLGETWPRPSPLVSVTHVLRYYYLRGCVHMACGNKRLAVRCFWTCLSIPGDAVSAIQIAAWKKMVLVQCLRLTEQGYVSDPLDPLAYPKTVSERLNRLINLALCMQPLSAASEPEDNPEIVHMVEATTPIGDDDQDVVEAEGIRTEKLDEKKNQAVNMSIYGYLAKDFINVDRAAFARLVDENNDVFVEDGNLGMVQQCQQALIRRYVYQLSSIYSVIPLEQLAGMLQVEVDAARCLLLKLAVDHAWEIGIQKSDVGTVVVTLPPLPSTNVDESMSDMMQLAVMVRDLDVSIATSNKFMSLVRKENSKNGRAKSSKSAPKEVENAII
ncbi:hypothetical protein FisN_10Lh089 [Fistulifera solaris]|uniref:COP9 signalosome complex subunit 3 n=1 Tax=Fistulifera solaris TaxID=1519565 RepID=A0A1Z5JT73_FISSO|nr:hypothetical protein FisN_10Lh089 [Fistulifera solaris]|eukprot:GAX17234.1 hypothetical protein FisN_10Lh089 [Fistulifera solaris]